MSSTPRRPHSLRPLWIVILAGAFVFGGIMVYRNNRAFFSKKSAVPAPVAPSVIAGKPGIAGKSSATVPEAARSTGPQKKIPVAADSIPVLRQSVVIPGVRCLLFSDNGLGATVSFELFFSGDSLRSEIMEKREQLKVMAQRVFGKKRADEVQTAALADEVRLAMNGILSTGAVETVEFRSFAVTAAPVRPASK
jgi:flagellar basal body-associated protein FliL